MQAGQVPLAQADPEVFALLEEEKRRQVGGLELIASEVRQSVLVSLLRACVGLALARG